MTASADFKPANRPRLTSEAWLVCHSDRHSDPWDADPAASHNRIPLAFPPPRTRRASSAKPHASALRLARQLAAQARQRQRALPPQVLADDTAARLLAVLYQDGLVDLANFNAGELGILLAKLTAAGFCEIGVNAIWITQSGQNFVGSLIPLSPETHGKRNC